LPVYTNKEYIYGINPAFEIVRAGRRKIYRAFFSDTLCGQERTRRLVELYKNSVCKVEFVNKGKLFDLCRTTEHQGAVIEADPYPYVHFAELLGQNRLLLLDNIEDPQNVGAILRSAEVFSWQHILLASRGTPEIYPSVVKAGAGATEYLRIARDHPANYYFREAVENGFTVVALDGKGKTSLDELKIPLPAKIMLVIGGEHLGVGQFILNAAHYTLKIPLAGKISSLNASVAAGIALFSLSRSFRLAIQGPGLKLLT